MSEQRNLFDTPEAQRRKVEAMDRVERHARPDWKTEVHHAIQRVAASQPFLTTDDVWFELSKQSAVTTHENRAIGPAMTGGKRAGFMEPTDRHTTCKRPCRHGGTVRVWRSLIYRGDATR